MKIKVKQGRSREGAWIEIVICPEITLTDEVAPVRERGLKYSKFAHLHSIGAVAPVRERGLKYRIYR